MDSQDSHYHAVLGSDSGGEAVSLFNVSQVQSLPVTFQQVQQATKRDPVLSKVLRHMTEGWPTQVPEELKAYHNRQHEISENMDVCCGESE